MVSVIAQMALTIGVGVLWRYVDLGGWSAERARGALTTAVYYIFLPALVLAVLWRAPLGVDSVKIALAAAAGVLVSLAMMGVVGRVMRLSRGQYGALLLAASFPNATYMGLPLMVSLFGDAGGAIAIQFDLFACTPILLTLGVFLASKYGSHSETLHPLYALLKVPPLWAAAIGTLLNLVGVAQPDWVGEFLDRLGAAVVPIMLLALGMSLRLGALTWKNLLTVSPALLIQLVSMPVVVWLMSLALGLTGDTRVAVVLIAATPTMVIGLVFCDRFGLDTEMYATTATASLLLALMTLPLWHHLLV
jgi:predicted permease